MNGMNGLVVLFFCIGLVMVFISVLLFVFVGVKYKENSKNFSNMEDEKMELEAILSDARELLKQLDEYSSGILESIDKRVDEFRALVKESRDNIDNVNKVEKLSNQDKLLNEFQQQIDTSVDKIANDLEEIKNPAHKNIMKLYYSGESIENISKSLSMGKGEVKLIISRYQK